jgi:hypothetical protein
LDWHPGQPGKNGWRGKDHWHINNGDAHLVPGDEIPDPLPPAPAPAPEKKCDANCQKRVETARDLTTGALILIFILSCIPTSN